MTEYTITKIGETFAVVADGDAVISFEAFEPAFELVSRVLADEKQISFDDLNEAAQSDR